MTDVPERLTPIEETIRVLESYRKGGIADTGARTPLDGFSQALRIVRTLFTVYYTTGGSERLLQAFFDYADFQSQSRTIIIDTCTSCGKNHGDQRMVLVKADVPEAKYWGICPILFNPMFYDLEE